MMKEIYGIFVEGYDPDGDDINEFQYHAFENEDDAKIFVRENQSCWTTRLFYAPIILHCNKESS